ncbi:MAG: hypothetical protein HUU02_03700 [Bacteroidetes bacterium]|nr:hypothetical protein [Bacteroidota bacterium]
MRTFLLSVICCALLTAQSAEERTLLLRSGDKISGTVVTENDTAVVLKTSFGEISVLKSSIKPQSITVYLKDGSVVSGEIESRSDAGLRLRTSFGVVTIDQANVDRTSEGGTFIPGTMKDEEFLYADERLIDIFFDPTGYTMEKGAIYISGLSWGVALSENIDVSSSYWRYFLADLNIRPKFRLYKSGSIESEQSFAVGFHFHSAGMTGKMRYVSVTEPVYNWNGPTTYQTMQRWESVGDASDSRVWTEFFAAYTLSNLKADKQGRISYHLGASVIVHPEETMPRAWIALDNDITSKFKIIGQLYYDPYQPSYRQMGNEMRNKSPFDLDFGFVYAYDENLRFGIHYQPYVILFYLKF